MRRILKSCVALLAAASVVGCGPTAAGPTTPPPQATPAGVTAAPSSLSTPAPTPQLGGQIVFADGKAASGNWQIYIENADGTNLRQLVRSDADDFTPSLSPDGTQVVFHRVDKSGTHDQILVVNVDGTHLHQVKPDGCFGRCEDAVEGSRAWSRDGHILIIRSM
ncbi:MAG TPA: hypothetical protein VGQ85_04595, partial [Candidatus Limnocylindrales bacterium]|nr:hypothetical protein [Candidatus Limnocylindrales bacterium]